jgi:hypothetical protein
MLGFRSAKAAIGQRRDWHILDLPSGSTSTRYRGIPDLQKCGMGDRNASETDMDYPISVQVRFLANLLIWGDLFSIRDIPNSVWSDWNQNVMLA